MNRSQCGQGGHSRPRLAEVKLHLVFCEQGEPGIVGFSWMQVGTEIEGEMFLTFAYPSSDGR